MTSQTWQRVVSYYARPASFSTGGVNLSSQEWMKAIANYKLPVAILAAEGGYIERLVEDENLEFLNVPHFGKRRMTMLPRSIQTRLRRDDLVFLHEGWTPSNLFVAFMCRLLRVSYVLVPHGVYAPELIKDLRFLSLRKQFEIWIVRGALAVHVFFEREAREVEELFGRVNCVVAATGHRIGNEGGRRHASGDYIAWLGRYDINHKGIDRLLAAMSCLEPSVRPTIVMHGPDHRGDRARVDELVAESGLQQWVSVRDELEPNEAQDFLGGSTAFVHVPRWEAFGHTVVEALSLGIPVLLSRDAQIAEPLEAAHAAIVVDADNHERLGKALTDINYQYADVGARGREWVASNLSWESQVIRLFSQLESLGKKSRYEAG